MRPPGNGRLACGLRRLLGSAGQDQPKLLNLALQRGGAHGAFTWGVLDRLLEEERIGFEGLSGASAGALNAVVLASGYLAGGRAGAQAALTALWEGIADHAPFPSQPGRLLRELTGDWNVDRSAPHVLFDLLTRLLPPRHLNPLAANPLRSILDGIIDFDRLRRERRLKVFVAATSLSTGRARVFTNPELSTEALLASACLPHLNEPQLVNGVAYWDGGFTANPPILPLVERCDARDVLLVQLDSAGSGNPPADARDILANLHRIVFDQPLAGELRALALGVRIAEDGVSVGGRLRRRILSLRFHLIDASDATRPHGVGSKLVPNRAFLAHLRERGRGAADEWLAGKLDRVGKESTAALAAG